MRAAPKATSAQIIVRVYSGSSVTGALLQSITAPRLTGNWYVTEPQALVAGDLYGAC